MRWPLFLLPLLAAFPLVACGDDDADDGDGVQVVATTAVIGALTREVAQDNVRLSVLISPGVDPHDYEPTAADLRRIGGAKLVLKNGLHLDDFLDRAISSAGGNARVVTVTDGIQPRVVDGEEDPHVWHDPANVQVMVANIADALAEADPQNAAVYRDRAEAYARQLHEVDQQIRDLIESIPPPNRKMVSNHDSFGYFNDRYGIEFIGAVLPGLGTSSEPSAREIADLIETIRRENVKAIFAEETVEPRIARRIAEDTGVQIIDDLYGDSLGEPGSGAETVDGLLLYNARKIAEALR
jgi:ABC-type Zn uptake system ZnuABC Zn-binding protein ZnuA